MLPNIKTFTIEDMLVKVDLASACGFHCLFSATYDGDEDSLEEFDKFAESTESICYTAFDDVEVLKIGGVDVAEEDREEARQRLQLAIERGAGWTYCYAIEYEGRGVMFSGRQIPEIDDFAVWHDFSPTAITGSNPYRVITLCREDIVDHLEEVQDSRWLNDEDEDD